MSDISSERFDHIRSSELDWYDLSDSDMEKIDTIDHATALLSSLEAWGRVSKDHTAQTPRRMVEALKQLTEREPFIFTTFPSNGLDEMITVGPIQFYTVCAHHVLPFHGSAWIGYIPSGKIAGLSKFARTVKWCAKGFWVQEELTIGIANFLKHNLGTESVAVVLKAEHMCMAMRGAEAHGVITTTSSMSGVFADHTRTAKAEFMNGVK